MQMGNVGVVGVVSEVKCVTRIAWELWLRGIQCTVREAQTQYKKQGATDIQT